MSSPLLAELTPHPFSCCTFQPPVGSQVSAQEGQGSPSGVWGSFPFGPGHRGLAWMETLLSSELGRDRVLGVRTELGDHPPRPSTGSTKAEPPLVSGTALRCMPGLCMWLLGSGKQSILLTRMEWKEGAQSRGSAWRVPVPPPPMLTHTPREGRRSCPRRLIGAAGSPLLTLRLLESPGEVFDVHVLELEQVLQASHLHLQDLGGAP